MANNNFGSKIIKRSLSIITNAAKDKYLGADYTSNISQLATDSKIVLNQLSAGKSKVADIVSDIKQNGGKKLADWFFDGDMATGEYDLMANNDSDFDAGYQLGDGESAEDEPAPSKILDYDSMKDVARGQVNAMYKIAGKQAEASMLNAAEITSTINGRAAELITAVNNVNNSVMGISEKLDTLIKLQSSAIEQAEEEANREAYGIVGSDGRATLGSFTKYIQSSASNLLSGPLEMAKQFMTPENLFSLFVLDPLNLENKDIGKGLNKIGFLKDRQFVKDLQGKTWDSLGKGINEAVGNSVHDVLTGQFGENNVTKKLDQLLSSIPMVGDLIKSTLQSSMGLKGDDLDNYKSTYKSSYNTDASKFDGKVYTTIVDIIPEYLKIITKSLTGKDFRVRQSGDAAGTLTDEKYNARKSTDYSSVRGNTIASNMGQSFMDSVEQGVQEIFLDQNTSDAFNKHKDDIYELFTLEAVSFFAMNGYKVTGIQDLVGDDFWNYIQQQMIRDYKTAIPGLQSFNENTMIKFINSIKANIIKARSANIMSSANQNVHRLAQDITRRVAEFKTANTARTKDQVLNRTEATNISHDELIENFKNNGQLRSYENKYQEASNKIYEEIEKRLSAQGGDNMNRILRDEKRKSIARDVSNEENFSKVKIDENGTTMKIDDLQKKIAEMSSYGDSSDLKDLTSQVNGIGSSFTTNIDNFRDGVFSRLDKIISLIPRRGHGRGGSIPQAEPGAGSTVGSGDIKNSEDNVSKSDELVIASANAMIQSSATDGELSSDLPIIKRMFGNIKNKNLSGKLFTMWTTVGNNLKSKVASVKENGIGATLKNFFGGGLIGILTKGVKIIVSTIGTLFLSLVARPFLKLMKKGIMSGVNDIKSGFGGLKQSFADAKAKREEKKAEKEKQKSLNEQNAPLTQSPSDVANSVGLSGMDGSPASAGSSSDSGTSSSDTSSSSSSGGGTLSPAASSGGGTSAPANSGIGSSSNAAGATGGNKAGIGGKISGAVGKVGSAVGKVGKGVTGFISKITSAFSNMLAAHPILKIVIGIAKIIGTLVAGMAVVKTFIKKIRDAITKGLEPLKKGIESIIKTLDPLVKMIGNVVKKLATGLSKMLEMLTGVFKILSDVVGSVLESVLKMLDPVLSVLSALLAVAVKILEPILKLVTNILEPVLDIIVNMLDSIVVVFDALTPLFDIITESVQALSTLLDPFVAFMTDIMLASFEPLCFVITKVIGPAVQIVSGVIQVIYGAIKTLIGDLIRNISLIFGLLANKFGKQEDVEQAVRATAWGTDMKLAGANDVKTGLQAITHPFASANKVSAEEASSSNASSSIPAASASNGAAVDTYGSGPGDDDPIAIMLGGIGKMLQRVMVATEEAAVVVHEAAKDGIVPIHNVLFKFREDFKHYKLKIDLKINSALRNLVAPRLVDLVSNSKLMIGTMQNDDAQLLAAMGLLLAAQGQGGAGSALFNTAAGMAASGLVMANTGVVGSMNNFNKMAGLDPMSLSKLYEDVNPDAIAEEESTDDGSDPTSENVLVDENGQPILNENGEPIPVSSDTGSSDESSPSTISDGQSEDAAADDTYEQSQVETSADIPTIDDGGSNVIDMDSSTISTDNDNSNIGDFDSGSTISTEIPAVDDSESNIGDMDSSTISTDDNTNSDDTSTRYYYQITGSGNSQGSYGSYMNMTKHGCGPVALADAFSRRGGGNVNAGSLAQGMASNGNYSTSKGTSVGGFLDTAKAMGMGYTVGGVSQGSLKRATPDNPVTIVGSGSGFGTRSGNNHYVNVVGTDSNGGAYISNPISGRIERHSTNDVVSGSIVGLYGSGPEKESKSELEKKLEEDMARDIEKKNSKKKEEGNNLWYGDDPNTGYTGTSKSSSSKDDKIKLNDVKKFISEIKKKYPKLYKQLMEAYSIECKNKNLHTPLESWLRSKLPDKMRKENLPNAVNMLKELTAGVIINDGGNINPDVSEEVEEGEELDISDTTSSASTASTGSLAGNAAIKDNYVGNTQRHTAEQAYADALLGKKKVDSSTTGSSFSSVFKSAMSGLSGIFNNILGIFTMSEDEELAEAEDEDKQKALEEELRATLGNDEYEAYQNAGFVLYQQANPRGNHETLEQYKKRLAEAWKDEATRRKWTNLAAKDDAAYINAAKINDVWDAENQADTTIWGGYDPETGEWTGGLMGGSSTATGGAGIGGGGSVSGGTTEQQVWMYLTKVLGFTPQGAAGVLGNMEAESGVQPNNLEDTYNKSLGMTDEEYTSAVDSGTYTRDKFISDHNKAGCGAGYGLVQFTAENLKAALYDTAKEKGVSIADVGAQMDAITKTVDSDLIEKLKTTTDVNEASDLWLRKYERPANLEGNVGPRRSKAQKYYDTYSTWNGEGVTVNGGPSGGVVAGTSYGPSLSKITMNDSLRSAAGSTWEKYKNKEGISNFFQQAANSSMTPQQQALIMAMGIWEDGARKLIGEKSLTKVTKDKNGQRAVGLMNWIPNSDGDTDTSFGSTLAEQLSYIQKGYFSENPEHDRGKVNGSNLNSYRNALETLAGHSLVGQAGDPIGPIINQDLVEGSGHYVGGALVPEGWSTVSGLGKYVGVAADVYNWMLDNGYTSGGAGGGAANTTGGTGTVVGKYNTAYNVDPRRMGLGKAVERGGTFANYAFGNVNGINNTVYSSGLGGASNGTYMGNGGTVLGTVPSVVKAYEAVGVVGNKGDYNQSGKTHTLTINGKTFKERPDCTGLVDSVIDVMGYQSEGMNSARFQSAKGIKDASGAISPDWQMIDNPSISSLQGGDIGIIYSGGAHHGEIVSGVENNNVYGFSYGWEGGMQRALAAVNDMINNGTDAFTATKNNRGTINGHGRYSRAIRYVGKSTAATPSTATTATATTTSATATDDDTDAAVSAVTANGDIPPVDMNKIFGDENGNVTNNNILVQRANVSNEKMMEDLQNMTFNVRAQKVEELLEEISKKMDDIKNGRKIDSSRSNDKQSNVNPFDDNIPMQIQRLSIG